MQFKVPKFLEREMKIFGPITMRLFIIFIVGAAILAILYANLPKRTFYIITGIVVLSFAASIFVKVDGIPLYQLYPSLFSFLFSPKVVVWKGKGQERKLEYKKGKEIPLERGKSKLSQIQTLVQTKK